MAASPQQRPLRILCLPGFRTSGRIMKAQLAGFLSQPGFDIQYDTVDATFPASGAPDETIRRFFPNMDYFEWWCADENKNYVGYEKTFERVAQMLAEANPPYDGVLGFSQGAVLTSMLARLSTAEGALRDDRFAGKLRFAVMIAGFIPRDKQLAERLFHDELPPIDLPSLHIWGAEDALATSCSTLTRKFVSEKQIIHLHTGNHVVPRLKKGEETYDRVRGFFHQFAVNPSL